MFPASDLFVYQYVKKTSLVTQICKGNTKDNRYEKTGILIEKGKEGQTTVIQMGSCSQIG